MPDCNGASVLVFDLRFQLLTLALAMTLLWAVERVPLWKLLALMVPFALFGFGFLTTSLLFNTESGFALRIAREQGAAVPDAAPGLGAVRPDAGLRHGVGAVCADHRSGAVGAVADDPPAPARPWPGLP